LITPYWAGVLTGVLGVFVFLALLAAWGDWIVARDKADLEKYRVKKPE
jgi:hypothetical protein